jgi:moderate conductance mechanosensitive channel
MIESFSKLLDYSVFRAFLTLILIILLMIAALHMVNLAMGMIEKNFIAATKDADRRARLHTLSNASRSTLQIVIIAIGVLIGMGTIGIDIGPALAAAGILGLAVSLGAQTLIKDVIGGITILLEDQFHVGDFVEIGPVSGEVEGITLRRTDVRDSEGRLFMVPNGEVRVVANETRDWARALVELNFGFDTDQNKALAALEEALARVADDPRIKPHLLAPPEIFGWNDINDWAVVVRLSVKVLAGKQVVVARVLRQYALEALHEADIPVESPARRVFLSSCGKPVDGQNA